MDAKHTNTEDREKSIIFSVPSTVCSTLKDQNPEKMQMKVGIM